MKARTDSDNSKMGGSGHQLYLLSHPHCLSHLPSHPLPAYCCVRHKDVAYTHTHTHTRRKYQCMRREVCVYWVEVRWEGGKLEQLLATFYLKNCKQFYTKDVELFLYLTSSVLASSLSCVRKEQLLHAVYLFTHFLSASNSGHCICLSYSHARERLCDNRRSLSLSSSR